MDEARRKLRLCLIIVVLAAVAVGVIYYFTDVYGQNKVSDGTLVKNGCVEYRLESAEGLETWRETA